MSCKCCFIILLGNSDCNKRDRAETLYMLAHTHTIYDINNKSQLFNEMLLMFYLVSKFHDFPLMYARFFIQFMAFMIYLFIYFLRSFSNRISISGWWSMANSCWALFKLLGTHIANDGFCNMSSNRCFISWFESRHASSHAHRYCKLPYIIFLLTIYCFKPCNKIYCRALHG